MKTCELGRETKHAILDNRGGDGGQGEHRQDKEEVGRGVHLVVDLDRNEDRQKHCSIQEQTADNVCCPWCL